MSVAGKQIGTGAATHYGLLEVPIDGVVRQVPVTYRLGWAVPSFKVPDGLSFQVESIGIKEIPDVDDFELTLTLVGGHVASCVLCSGLVEGNPIDDMRKAAKALKQKDWATDHPDVCKYARPRLVKVPVDYNEPRGKTEVVSCKIPEDSWCHLEGDNTSGDDKAHAQACDAEREITHRLQDEGQARIQRLLKWPMCNHTFRGVSLVWSEDLAHWVCEVCALKSLSGVGQAEVVDAEWEDEPSERAKLVWRDGHMTVEGGADH